MNVSKEEFVKVTGLPEEFYDFCNNIICDYATENNHHLAGMFYKVTETGMLPLPVMSEFSTKKDAQKAADLIYRAVNFHFDLVLSMRIFGTEPFTNLVEEIKKASTDAKKNKSL